MKVFTLAFCLACAMCGCAGEKAEVKQASGDDGVIAKQVHKADDVSAKESDYVKSGEAIAYGTDTK
jgi:hypothetical protein